MRKIKFQNNEYYHIYNRGVDKRDVFMDEKDYERFLLGIKEFNTVKPIESLRRLKELRKKEILTLTASGRLKAFSLPEAVNTELVEIICYSLLPNHYHLIIKQKKENGISKFMQKLGMGYTHYFNKKYHRTGILFQGQCKSIYINKDSYLLWLSCYINPVRN